MYKTSIHSSCEQIGEENKRNFSQQRYRYHKLARLLGD